MKEIVCYKALHVTIGRFCYKTKLNQIIVNRILPEDNYIILINDKLRIIGFSETIVGIVTNYFDVVGMKYNIKKHTTTNTTHFSTTVWFDEPTDPIGRKKRTDYCKREYGAEPPRRRNDDF